LECSFISIGQGWQLLEQIVPSSDFRYVYDTWLNKENQQKISSDGKKQPSVIVMLSESFMRAGLVA